jgi:glucosamine-6-phosphate deaminase
MNTNLFDHVNIDKTKTNVPDGMATDSDAECERYDSVVSSMNGVDIQLLGIGHDGHIGFNEPCETFPKGTHVVKLTETTIKANSRLFASVDDVPREALTMGIGTIMAAKCVVLIASGKDKAEIVKKAFFGEVTPLIPASILQFHKNAILVADEDALSECNI